jgi:hypothetical protein
LQSAYCGAKHAVKGFTESVITELKHEKSKVRICQVHLPGVNTVQFDWNDNEFDEHPQPVAPIFQPELPARAVRFVAEHPRRTMWVGVSTAYTILGNRVAPWFLDWYLGRTGVKGQLTADDASPDDPVDLWEPADADRDFGANGRFTDRSWHHDPQIWASRHHGALAAAGAGVLAVAAAALGRRR